MEGRTDKQMIAAGKRWAGLPLRPFSRRLVVGKVIQGPLLCVCVGTSMALIAMVGSVSSSIFQMCREVMYEHVWTRCVHLLIWPLLMVLCCRLARQRARKSRSRVKLHLSHFIALNTSETSITLSSRVPVQRRRLSAAGLPLQIPQIKCSDLSSRCMET